jgi:hypothetical protein
VAEQEVVITPSQVRLAAVGDTMRLHASLYDGDGNPVASPAVTWTSADPSIFTIDQNGLVTGKQALSVGRAIASASGLADTAYVVVADPNASPCLGSAAPVALAIGQSLDLSMRRVSGHALVWNRQRIEHNSPRRDGNWPRCDDEHVPNTVVEPDRDAHPTRPRVRQRDSRARAARGDAYGVSCTRRDSTAGARTEFVFESDVPECR